MYKVSDFDYYLPEELIAQQPVEPRDSSRLMVLNKKEKQIEQKIFRDIVEYLKPGDLLVFNVSKVIPARLYGQKSTGARIEVLLLEHLELRTWKCLVKPGKSVKDGTEIIFEKEDAKAVGKCIGRAEEGTRIIQFDCENEELYRLGKLPLPHYIKNENVPLDRYQTIYAKIEGSVAAPTAGLHFTQELLQKIKEKGVDFAEVVLHVGLGTFRPVKVENLEEHDMHEEYYMISSETVKKIRETKTNGGRVIAVGTTSVRTLETIARCTEADSYSGKSKLFIYPPFEFKIVNGLVTNFHLPRSTLIMLVSAFAGYDFTMEAYRTAVEQKFRFFSFGDAMFIF